MTFPKGIDINRVWQIKEKWDAIQKDKPGKKYLYLDPLKIPNSFRCFICDKPNPDLIDHLDNAIHEVCMPR